MQYDIRKILTVSHLIAFGLGIAVSFIFFIVLMFIGI